MTTFTDIKKHSVTLGLSLLLLGLGQNNASALSLPDVPLSVFSNVEHNVLYTFDDSGSMERGFLPDGLSGIQRRHCATTTGNTANAATGVVEGNGIAYDPAVLYTPPPLRDGPSNLPTGTTNMPAASFGAAWISGFITGSSTVDLSNLGPASTATHQRGYRPVWGLNELIGTLAANTYATCAIAAAFVPAFYFRYNAATGGCSPRTAVTEANDACYTQVNVSATSGTGPAGADERINFANWYSYYRSRNLAAKSASGRAFRSLDTNVRVAGHHLNNGGLTAGPAGGITFTNTTSTTLINVMRRFCDDPLNNDALCTNGSTARTDFFTRLYNSPAALGTPLRDAMQRAGNSFSTVTNNLSPYRAVPGDPATVANPELSCRKNFHILMTDGYWNPNPAGGIDTDGVARTLGDGTAYTPMAPYSDAWAGTLADRAFDFWSRDLRADLTNNVKASERDATGSATQRYWNPKNNPATWQHMQTFTVGLGLAGNRNPANYFNLALAPSAGHWDELQSGALAWPNPTDAEDRDRIDDLWHAAINGRGDYFAAGNPDQLVNAFNQIIGQISRDTGSAAGLGSSGSTTSGGTSIFQVGLDTSLWAGRLISRPVDVNGTPLAAAWEAGTAGLNTQSYDVNVIGGRKIITYNPTNALGSRGVPFQWTSLNAAQQTALRTNFNNGLDPVTTGEARLNYLRGASINEGPPPVTTPPTTNLGFRKRTCYDPATVSAKTIAGDEPIVGTCAANVGKLGDIVDSSPVYVGKPDSGYPDTIQSGVGNEYSAFVTAQTGRQKMVYVGANDGMLHGFKFEDGKEAVAYVPNLVYTNIDQKNLSLLTSPFYSHRFYVNATPTVGDAFISGAGGGWRTMLVGGLRKGGKGYYALDITNPTTFTETNAAQIAKWEFTDPDLGYSYSQPAIVKMATGQWAAVFGSGYNEDNITAGTGRAMIYIVNIADGSLIQKIDTLAGGGGGTTALPNGMGTPAVVDLNDDYIADYIYAGDLFGNMWRIDVRSSTPANWSTSANVLKLFTATDGATPTPAVQPITTKPSVGFHPLGYGGLMVYFGTGRYLDKLDNVATGVQVTQTFYGVYDRGATGRAAEPSRRETTLIARTDLLQQTITAGPPVTRPATLTTPAETFNTRNISDSAINWRLDRSSTTTHLGWYVTLPENGEKQVTDPLLREGRIIFTTLSPNTNACNPGGTGWLMELDSTNGGRIDETLDLDGNGQFNSSDGGGSNYGAAGAQAVSGGSLSSPIVLTNPDGPPPPGGPRYSETKLVVTSKGTIISLKESGTPNAPEAWRQLK